MKKPRFNTRQLKPAIERLISLSTYLADKIRYFQQIASPYSTPRSPKYTDPLKVIAISCEKALTQFSKAETEIYNILFSRKWEAKKNRVG